MSPWPARPAADDARVSFDERSAYRQEQGRRDALRAVARARGSLREVRHAHDVAHGAQRRLSGDPDSDRAILLETEVRRVVEVTHRAERFVQRAVAAG